MKRIILSIAAVAWMFAPAAVHAQDPLKADAKHYTLVFENDAVRVLRVHFEPGEKSAMHEHPNAVAVFLTDYKSRSISPDGNSEKSNGKAGQAQWTPAGTHQQENVGNDPVDIILVEVKARPAAK